MAVSASAAARKAPRKRRVEATRVDHAAVLQHDLRLANEERRLGHQRDVRERLACPRRSGRRESGSASRRRRTARAATRRPCRAPIRSSSNGRPRGHKVDEHLSLAVADAAGLHDRDLEAAAGEEGTRRGHDGHRAVRSPAGPGADEQRRAGSARGAGGSAARSSTTARVFVTQRAAGDALDHVDARRRHVVPASRAAGLMSWLRSMVSFSRWSGFSSSGAATASGRLLRRHLEGIEERIERLDASGGRGTRRPA